MAGYIPFIVMVWPIAPIVWLLVQGLLPISNPGFIYIFAKNLSPWKL